MQLITQFVLALAQERHNPIGTISTSKAHKQADAEGIVFFFYSINIRTVRAAILTVADVPYPHARAFTRLYETNRRRFTHKRHTKRTKTDATYIKHRYVTEMDI